MPLPRRPVPGWALASAALAPVAMIGGWTLAAGRQETFDPVRETISALAAAPSTSPWIMTTGLALTGVCHGVTAAGLRSAHPVGRGVLALAGVATVAVAALPVGTWPRAHGVAAAVAFVGLTAWPVLASRAAGPGAVSLRTGVAATTGLSVLLLWFGLELQQVTPSGGAVTGLAERALAGAQSLWPLAVVLLLRAHLRTRGPRAPQVSTSVGSPEPVGKGDPR